MMLYDAVLQRYQTAGEAMPPDERVDELAAKRWLRELFRKLGAKHPGLKTTEAQERLTAELERQEQEETTMAERLCTYCQAPATHTLWPDRDRRRMVAREADFPRARQEYCGRCAEALSEGETGEHLARRLNAEDASHGETR